MCSSLLRVLVHFYPSRCSAVRSRRNRWERFQSSFPAASRSWPGWISRRRSCVCHVHAPSSAFSHAASGAVETLLTTRLNMFCSTWSSGVLQGQLTGHLLILRTGKEENKETGLGPLLLHLQKSAGRQMLRFLPSGTPGKTLRAHTSVCADTPLVCVQIKHTTHRC